MPLVLVAALAASLTLHGLMLWGPVFNLSQEQGPVPLPLLEARLQGVSAVPSVPPPTSPVRQAKRFRQPAKHSPAPAVPVPPSVPAESIQEPDLEGEDEHPLAGVTVAGGEALFPPGILQESPAPGQGGEMIFPSEGRIQYVVFRGERFFQVGKAEHQWRLRDGRYRLYSVMETTGLAAMVKPLVLETLSEGRVERGGLVPERYQGFRDGEPNGESADFDWSGGQVKIPGRGDYPLASGSQDLLSLHYHLAYLPHLENGVAFRVATGKKYELFHFDALGEAMLETPAGSFRTLHLQSLGNSRTEIWLALDHFLLPVKIRHTDRKGNLFDQVAVQLNLAAPLPE